MQFVHRLLYVYIHCIDNQYQSNAISLSIAIDNQYKSIRSQKPPSSIVNRLSISID